MLTLKRIKNLVYRFFPKEEIKTISDKFIVWLRFANAGMLHEGNIWCFDYAISHLPSQAPIIEIGSFCGLSTNLITYLKLKHRVSNPLICSDAWNFQGVEQGGSLGGHPSIQHQDYKEFVKSTFIRNVSFFSKDDLPFSIELTSDDFFPQWEQETYINDVFGRAIKLGGSISFAYIDGNHSYDFVNRDFQNIDKFLEIGGFILFDDSADNSGWDVCKVVEQVVQSGRYQLVTKNPNYLFKKLKHNANP